MELIDRREVAEIIINRVDWPIVRLLDLSTAGIEQAEREGRFLSGDLLRDHLLNLLRQLDVKTPHSVPNEQEEGNK